MLARVVGILALAGMAACSNGSGSNPLGSLGSNPFGGGGGATEAATVQAPAPGVLVAQLETAVPEPALRGLIIRASAITPTQGYWGATLYPVNEGRPDERGIVTYQFRAYPPEGARPVGPVQTRRLIAATFISDADLANIRGFRVQARDNSADLRR